MYNRGKTVLCKEVLRLYIAHCNAAQKLTWLSKSAIGWLVGSTNLVGVFWVLMLNDCWDVMGYLEGLSGGHRGSLFPAEQKVKDEIQFLTRGSFLAQRCFFLLLTHKLLFSQPSAISVQLTGALPVRRLRRKQGKAEPHFSSFDHQFKHTHVLARGCCRILYISRILVLFGKCHISWYKGNIVILYMLCLVKQPRFCGNKNKQLFKTSVY